jgi:hypothetical protein
MTKPGLGLILVLEVLACVACVSQWDAIYSQKVE